jgi:type IV pilus assembly protein PilC
MPTFAYTCRDQSGGSLSGTLFGDTAAQVMQTLRSEGKYPTSIKLADVADETGRPRTRGYRMGRKDLIQIATQLSIMIETGVTVTDALDSIAQQAEKPNVKRVLADITEQVQAGSDFSSALQRHPSAFPRIFISLMSAREKSGMMGKLLQRATAYLQDEYEIIRKVRGALTYPAIMLGFAVSTTTFLLAFVLPRFTSIYARKKAALPVPTQILMATSNFLVNHWVLILLAVGAIAGSFITALRTPGGARAFHYCQLRIPLLGTLFKQLYLSRGLRMVGTMSGAGVSLVDCVKTAEELCANGYFKDLWIEVSQQIQAGKQLSEPLFRSNLVPRPVSQMLHSAERSGRLAQVMEQVAAYSEQELREKISEMTRYIEPLMIMVMGAIIGSVALALMLPIFTISKVIAQ